VVKTFKPSAKLQSSSVITAFDRFAAKADGTSIVPESESLVV